MTLLRTARALTCFTVISLFLFLGLPPVRAAEDAQPGASSPESGAPLQQQWVNSVEESLRLLQLQMVSIIRHEMSFTGSNNWPEYLPGYREELQRRYDMFISEGNRLLEILEHPRRVATEDLKEIDGLLKSLEGQARSLSRRRLIATRDTKPVLPPGCDFSKACAVPDCSVCCISTGRDQMSLIIASRSCGVCRVLRTVCALKDSFDKVSAQNSR